MPGLLRPLMVPVMRLRAASESQAEVVVEVGERDREKSHTSHILARSLVSGGTPSELLRRPWLEDSQTFICLQCNLQWFCSQ